MDRIWRFYEPRVFGSHLFGVFAVEGVQETLDFLGDDFRIFPFPGLLQPCALVCGYVFLGKDCACLRGSGARVHCRARSCADTRIWARIALVSPCFLCSCVKDVDMPVVVLDRCPVSTCRKLRSPAVAVRRSGRDVSVGQQRQVRTVLLCIRQLHGWCLLDS